MGGCRQPPYTIFLIFCVKSNTVNCVSGSSFMPQGSSGDGCCDGGSRSGSKFSFKLSAGLGLQLLLQTDDDDEDELEEEDEGDGDGSAAPVHKASLDVVSTISC